MSRSRKRQRQRPPKRLAPSSRKVGQSPGTVIYTGAAPTDSVSIDVISYGPEHFEELKGVSADQALASRGDGRMRWIDVYGVHDTATLERIGIPLRLHPLTLEDIANVGQRPKVERFDNYLYLVLRTVNARRLDGPVPSLVEEQLSVVLAGDLVVTFHERPNDTLDPLRERLRGGRGRSRRLGADYLAYAVVDVVVDHYFSVLERLSGALEALETRALDAVTPSGIDDVFALKRELLQLRRVAGPTRDLLASLARGDDDSVTPPVRTFLRDAHDHALQVMETVEALRESASGVLETSLAGLTLRTNQATKLLTVIATLFIPLTFVVGVYGMNFEHMPELAWRWGYPAVWLLMLSAVLVMLLVFRRKRLL